MRETDERHTFTDCVRVVSRNEAIKLLGLSDRTFQRLEAKGDVPPKTRFSAHRIGYRISDLKEWLDARREGPSARDMIDSWRPLYGAANRAMKHLYTNRAGRVDAPLPPAAVGQPGITTTQDDENEPAS